MQEPKPTPTQQEIRAECLLIQSTWSPREERIRRGFEEGDLPAVEIPFFDTRTLKQG